MENCLKTTLKGTVNNDNLRYLGKIIFDIPYVEGGSDVYLEFRSSPAITYSSTKANLTGGDTVTPSSSLTVQSSDVRIGNVVGGCTITIDNPYAITKLGINVNHIENNTLKKAINEQFDILEYCNNFKGVYYNAGSTGTGYVTLIETFCKKKWDNVKYVCLPAPTNALIGKAQDAVEYYAARNLKVCIPSFNGYAPLFHLTAALANTGLQYIYVRDEDFINNGFDNLPVSDLRTLGIQRCTGTLEALVTKLIAAGRSSGCLRIILVNGLATNITLGGTKLVAWCTAHSLNPYGNLYLTWESGGTNISLTSTQPSGYVAPLSWGNV